MSTLGVLTDQDKKTIQETWNLVVPIKETAADLFYKRLFELRPDYRSMFKSDMHAQKRKLIKMLSFVVKSLNWNVSKWHEKVEEADDLFLIVLAMGRRHYELYGVPDEAYDTVGAALIWTLDYGLGEAFTDEARGAWARIYDILAVTMKMGRTATDLGQPVEVD